MPREVCLRCLRPQSVCYCAALTTIATRTRVVILQHPRERGMPIGTARMACLCLPNASLHVGVRWDDSDVLRSATGDPERPAVLLWPGDGARDLLAEPPTGPVTLVVVDGTWPQAKNVVRDNPRLAALPRYAFRAPTPSNYRIRREPSVECVSTIEALMHALGALEGDAERFRALQAPMDAMVDRHLARQGDVKKPRVCRPRAHLSAAARALATVRARFDDLVCVAGEANAWRRDGEGAHFSDELVHWVAHRVATGETFDVVAAPRNPLAPTVTVHTGLDASRLTAAAPREELFAAFARFLRPTDLVCGWGTYGPHLYRQSGGTLPAAWFDLRAAARAIAGFARGVGAIEEYARRAAPDAATDPSAPRAVRRVGMQATIVAAWREPRG
jgi:DTW domain-containing protein YfiP